MNMVIVGASAGLGRALAEELAALGHRLLLVASDARDLEAVGRDLTLRYGGPVGTLAIDLQNFDADAFRGAVLARLDSVDGLFLVAGFGDEDDCGALPKGRALALTKINFVAPLLIANAFLDHLAARPRAHLVGIGSMAAIRGRSRNMVYGASKRGLEFYFEALRHRLSGAACKVQFYRVGFMATTMFKGRHGPLVAKPEQVAKSIVRRLDGREGAFTLSLPWKLISLVLRLLPYSIFRRLDV